MAINVYETVFIADPEVSNEQVEQIVAKLTQTITTHKGTLSAEDRWGRRRLAYPIQGHREGFYSVFSFTAEPTVVAALEHLFNVTDIIIRHITVRAEKKTKKFAPRRERPAGATTDSSRPGAPRTSAPRPRTDAPVKPAEAVAAPSAPAAAETAIPATTPAEGGAPQ